FYSAVFQNNNRSEQQVIKNWILEFSNPYTCHRIRLLPFLQHPDIVTHISYQARGTLPLSIRSTKKGLSIYAVLDVHLRIPWPFAKMRQSFREICCSELRPFF